MEDEFFIDGSGTVLLGAVYRNVSNERRIEP
jgi:hypothetical protein